MSFRKSKLFLSLLIIVMTPISGGSVKFASSETYPLLEFRYSTQGDIILEEFRISYSVTSNGTVYATVHTSFETRGMRPFMRMSFNVPENKIGVYKPCLVSIDIFYIQLDHNRNYSWGAFGSAVYYKAEQNAYSINLTDQVMESKKGFLASAGKDSDLLDKVGVKGGIDVSLAFIALAGQAAERRFYMKFAVSGIANTTSLSMEILLPEEATVEQASIDDKEITRYPPYRLQHELQIKPNEESPVHQAVVSWSLPKISPWYADPLVQMLLAAIAILVSIVGVLATIVYSRHGSTSRNIPP